MVEVWVAGEELADGQRRPCVIKRVAPAYKEFAALRKVLEEESRVASALSHKGIVCYYGGGEIEGLPYIQLELVDGVALRQLGALFSSPAFTPGPVVELGGRICESLAFAHDLVGGDLQPLNLVHRKISPANILLGRSGEVKVADFGVSFAGEQDPRTDFIPSPDQIRYLAPEQIQMGAIDGRADVFSVGVLMTELLSGHVLLPNGAMAVSDLPALVRERCAASPRGAVPGELTEIVVAMTATAVEHRPTANDAMLALQQAWGALDEPEYLATYLAREVFVNLPVIGGEPVEPSAPTEPSAPAAGSMDPTAAMLGTARVPGAALAAMSSGPSYPTTGSILLPPNDEPIDLSGSAVEPLPSDALNPLPTPPNAGLGSARLHPLPAGGPAPVAAPEAPPPDPHPDLEGTFRLGAKGVKIITSYDPYLSSIKVLAGKGDEAADTTKWEYFFITGDRAGPRLIRKGLDARFYRDQTVTLLEGSRLYIERIGELLADARPLPTGMLSARGGTGALDVGADESERFLRVHEARRPRPVRRETTGLKTKFLRFLGNKS